MSKHDSSGGAPSRQSSAVMRKKEFLEQVMANVTSNKREARAVVEATLQALSEALQQGKTLSISPLGKARVARVAGTRGDETYVVRFKPNSGVSGGGAAEPAAKPGRGPAATAKPERARGGKGGAKAAPKSPAKSPEEKAARRGKSQKG